jgi:hypothetical protein
VVDAVRDGIDVPVAEHRPGHTSVELRDAARVVAQVHGQERHGERVLAGEFLDVPRQHVADDAAREVVREHVVARRYRRVGGEGAGRANELVFEFAFFE